MFKEKVTVETIFDPEVLKPGTKVHAKYRYYIDDEYEDWEHDFIGEIASYKQTEIYIEDPKDFDYNIFSDESYPRKHRVRLEAVQEGFWVLELL